MILQGTRNTVGGKDILLGGYAEQHLLGMEAHRGGWRRLHCVCVPDLRKTLLSGYIVQSNGGVAHCTADNLQAGVATYKLRYQTDLAFDVNIDLVDRPAVDYSVANAVGYVEVNNRFLETACVLAGTL